MDTLLRNIKSLPRPRSREGEMRALIKRFDWKGAGIGDISTWSPVLRTAVDIMLNCAGPAYIAWGKRFVQLYNDAYIPILGSHKHPDALGRTTDETWHEIWDMVGPMFHEVMTSGTAIKAENHLFPMLRNGYLEECYFTFSYSPLIESGGTVGGVLVTAWETTTEYVTNRRTKALRTLAQELSKAATIGDIHSAFGATIEAYPEDLPFGLWYRFNEDRSALNLVLSARLSAGTVLSPEVLSPGKDAFYGRYININGPAQSVCLIEEYIKDWEVGNPLRSCPSQMFIKSLCYTSGADPDDYLVVAVNPMRPFDDAQREFLLAVWLHIENAMRRVTQLDRERRERDHQFQSVMAVLPCLVRLFDTNEQCTFANHTWLQFTGRSMEKELGEGWLEGVHEEDREGVRHCLGKADGHNEWTGEYRLRKADGSYRWVLDKVTPRYGISGEFLGYIATSMDITARKLAEQEIVSSQTALRSLYDRLQSVREEERLALAREVHDQLGQILSAAKIDIKLLEDDINASKRALPRSQLISELSSARRSIERAVQTVREIANELRAPELGAQGLYAALLWHVRDFERRTRITCNVKIAPNLPEPPGTAAIAVFRIFQESLTNILRHARANEVAINALYRGQSILLRIRDDGVGITRSQARSRHSIGIRGMRERAALLNGCLLIGRLQDGGTLVSLRVPIKV